MSEASFRVGILGAGYVADYHLRALQQIPGLEIVGIADPDVAKAKAMAARYSIPLACATLEELSPVQPNAIHVLTPPQFHADLSVKALAMGCHVYVEKPMAETVADCDRMIEAAAKYSRALSVNHSARMDPTVLEAVRLVKSGAIGDVMGVDFFRSSDYIPYAGGPSIPPQFRKGSYPFQDLGVHALYLLETFLGEIEKVDTRFFSTGREPFLTFDEWRVLAECKKGVGQIYLSWNVNPMQNELVIHGTKGVIHADCYVQYLTMRRKLPMIPKPIQRMGFVVSNGLGGSWSMAKNFFRILTGKLKGNPGIQIGVEKFYEAVRAGQPPPIPASEGRRMVRLMEEVSLQADAAKDARQATERSRPVLPAKVLVTGGGGFLGSALVKRLAQSGEPLRVLVRRPAAWLDALPNVQAVFGDLGDAEAVDRAVAGVETVYHVGAAMRGGKEEFERATVWGTRNMVDSCLRHNIKRLVYVSSLTVLNQAGHTPGTAVTESSSLEPFPERRGLYTQTKLAAEAVVLEAIAQRKLPAAIIRPGQIFGPGAERTSPAGAIGMAGRWIVVGNGSHQLPLVYVEDVVDGLLQAAVRPEALGAVIQLVDPAPMTQSQFVNICQRSQVLQPPIKSLYIPTWFMKLASQGVDMLARVLKRDLPLSPYRVASLRPPSPFDITAARTKLGWEPRVGTVKGLEITYKPTPK